MSQLVAIIGMSCRYADARSPDELWENVLAQRRAFRRIPTERLNLEDYYSSDRSAEDAIYATQAAPIEGYRFDRSKYRIAGSTFRAADMAHWLALDMASSALADAGSPDGEGLPREEVGVLVGNSLTGEFSRASVMRLRWPYVRRLLAAEFEEQGWPREKIESFLNRVQSKYKESFPPVGDETLAGGLSNTIAGRVCNYFDFGGGGYTVDGACASSLLAVANACSSLVAGDLDVALAGGVDLSLDPFELVGFSKVGALTENLMRVYDARSDGFSPGEGCGFLVLMRLDDAIRDNRRIHAIIRGWGISSDGSGGITRPKVDGQMRALRRAYRRAGISPASVGYFEGHGTGTQVGDSIELRALGDFIHQRQNPGDQPAAIGSVKANIGHTKAAAGIAGVIKATMAIKHQFIPPNTGCETPHPFLSEPGFKLTICPQGKPWPELHELRAGVSAMGFGGINTHIVLESVDERRTTVDSFHSQALTFSTQDTELFLFSAHDAESLKAAIVQVSSYAARISLGEMTDLSVELARTLKPSALRAAVIARNPEQLVRHLEVLLSWIDRGDLDQGDLDLGILISNVTRRTNVGFIFPGQGSPANLNGGVWRRRFPEVNALYDASSFTTAADSIATEIAQPAIVTASLSGLLVLDRFGVRASVATGHSLGELAAYYWAGVIEQSALLRIATARGRAIARCDRIGAMASILADETTTRRLLDDPSLVVSGINSPRQTVVSGQTDAIERLIVRAHDNGLSAISLPVSHAFHSPLVKPAAIEFRACLVGESFGLPRREIYSTVTGRRFMTEDDPAETLTRQITSPVRLQQAISNAKADVWLEVGPGSIMANLLPDLIDAPVISLDVSGRSLQGLFTALACLFVRGVPINHRELFQGRFSRPFDLNWQPSFFANPCESAPDNHVSPSLSIPPFKSDSDVPQTSAPVDAVGPSETPPSKHAGPDQLVSVNGSPQDSEQPSAKQVLRELISQRAELPIASVRDQDRFLSDLHLSSISVASIVSDAAQRLDLPAMASPTDYADSTIQAVATALEEMARVGMSREDVPTGANPAGVDTWVRAFSSEWVEQPLEESIHPVRNSTGSGGAWKVFCETGDSLQGHLQSALNAVAPAGGVALCLAPIDLRKMLDDWNDLRSSAARKDRIGKMLEAVHASLREEDSHSFLLVQRSENIVKTGNQRCDSSLGATALVRTLHLESPRLSTCVVTLPSEHGSSDKSFSKWISAEVGAALADGESRRYHEAMYDADGVRYVPQWNLLPLATDDNGIPLDSDDVLLVTGGGKGIAAECALRIALESEVKLALVGRSIVESDELLAKNLARFESGKVRFRYYSADVTDAQSLQKAVHQAQSELGPITAILHGAGMNSPKLIGQLDQHDFLATLAPKVDGLANTLAAIDPECLRMVVSFGSIIARTGMPGEADYGLANDWLGDLSRAWQRRHSHCQCLTLDWSVWSGVGMGERLGRIDSLRRQGISAITADEGVAILPALLRQTRLPSNVIVSGRFGDPPTLAFNRRALPLLRFLEKPRIFVPGVELVVDVDMSIDTDPYLADHVIDDNPLLPAVIGLEAMAQVVLGLTGNSQIPDFTNVELLRPVVIPKIDKRKLRLAALVDLDGSVRVTLRSAESDFQTDHFRAVCRFERDDPGMHSTGFKLPEPAVIPADKLSIDPDRDLYGRILFHNGRFRKIECYRHLRATECVAELSEGASSDWFGAYHPSQLLLGDPALRDAAIHAIQACIPHGTILPTGIDRLTVFSHESGGRRFVVARQLEQNGNDFIYDLEIVDEKGLACEQWSGLRLRRINDHSMSGVWPPSMLSSLVERRVGEIFPGADISFVVQQYVATSQAQPDNPRNVASHKAISRALSSDVKIERRPDGKPVVLSDQSDQDVSVSHIGSFAFALAGRAPVACDVETVSHRCQREWEELLGSERYRLATMLCDATDNENTKIDEFDVTATIVWTVIECLKKAGLSNDTPLVYERTTADGWVILGAGSSRIAAWKTILTEMQLPVVLTVLVRGEHARV